MFVLAGSVGENTPLVAAPPPGVMGVNSAAWVWDGYGVGYGATEPATLQGGYMPVHMQEH